MKKANLTADADDPAGSPMGGRNEGWSYLTDAEATWAYALCGLIFALFMIPGGRIQDKYGPKLGATLGGLFLAAGCILAGSVLATRPGQRRKRDAAPEAGPGPELLTPINSAAAVQARH